MAFDAPIALTIDGRRVEVAPGATIWEAARAAGIKPIREAFEAMSDSDVADVMSASAARASTSADKTMTMVREATGLT